MTLPELQGFAREAEALLASRFWRLDFWYDATAHLAATYWQSGFREEAEAILYFREREAETIRQKMARREDLARDMAELFGSGMGQLHQKYGPELVINALLDLACGLTSTSFPTEHLLGIFRAMGQRIADTDYRRAQARHAAAMKQGVRLVRGARKTPGGIIVPR